MSILEVIALLFVVILFALGSLAEKLANLVKQLKKSGSSDLGRGIQATLSVVSIDKKSEVCAANTNSKNDT